MKKSRYAENAMDLCRSGEYSSEYNFSTVRTQEPSENKENMLNESLRVSQMFSQGSAKDLPLALKLLDESLQKSNANVLELKENLTYVLQREKQLQTDFDNLSSRHGKKKEKYRQILGELKTNMKDQAGAHEQKREKYKTAESELKTKVRDQAEIISNYKIEISEKQAKIKEQDSELTALHHKCLQEKQRNTNLATEQETSEEQIEKLKQKSKNRKDASEGWQTKASEFQKQIMKLKEKLKNRKEESSSWQNKASEFQKQSRSNMEESLTLQKLLDTESSKRQRLEAGIQAIAKEFDLYRQATTNSMGELKEKVQTLVQSLSRKSEEIENLNSEWKMSQDDNRKLRERISGVNEENSKLKKEITHIGKDIDQIKTKQDEDLVEKTKLTKDMKSVQEDLRSALSDKAEISTELHTCKMDLKSAQEEQEELKEVFETGMEDLSGKLSTLQNENLELHRQVSESKSQLAGKEESFDKEINDLRNEFNQLGEKHQDTSNQLLQAQEDLSNVQSDLKKSDIKNKMLSEKFESHMEEISLEHVDQLKKAALEKSRVELQLKRIKNDASALEITQRKNNKEIDFWKQAILQISCELVVDRPKVEDILRSVLGVCPEQLNALECDQADYIQKVASKITEILQKETLVGAAPVDEQAHQERQLLQEMTEKYRREMNERRALHKMLQEMRGNIRVMCRIRPVLVNESNTETIQTMNMCQIKLVNETSKRGCFFEFDRVFPATDSQDVVYFEVSDLVGSVMDGYNVCIMAYGQTGSGKTYTMEGNQDNLGINYKALQELFEIIYMRKNEVIYEIGITIMEVYNESIRNLLDPDAHRIDIRETTKGGIQLTNVETTPIATYDDVIEAINIGKVNRSVGCTNINEYSSRSHCIVTIYVTGTSEGQTFTSKLNLIDLAGSERISKSEAEGVRLVEACNINQSLTALGKVLYGLAAKQSHIPYRDSKLTHLLKDSLSGDARTLMIIQVSPTLSDFGETTSSLSFGSRVACVEKGKPKSKNKSKTHAKNSSIDRSRKRSDADIDF